MSLLHISASPRGSHSESLALADEFVAGYRHAQPEHTVDTLDLWDGTLPAFGPDAAAAKMAVFAGQQPQGAAATAWQAAIDLFERFDSFDHYLFSVPMWNHGLPYVLKQFIDVVSQPGRLFGFDPAAGYSPLMHGKRTAVISTSAVYGTGRPAAFGTDFQLPYLRDWFRFAGLGDPIEIEFRPNLVTVDADDQRTAALTRAHTAGAELARC
ncbi:FMN-dependent NADH-azoreductase [Microlunatus soli]|uniref:FMN dependent NADH:quinone oxidoreductase n=1 Tax=Microlunatus soli TaxID=630515 RepID=A0A1H2AP40_9ACTN|nr:NAD(P)H-dependent oxidoreductase [Microlunatus soli]SDT47649.1 FMN-dependent NADH-azoreductase [Microlunatus soli]